MSYSLGRTTELQQYFEKSAFADQIKCLHFTNECDEQWLLLLLDTSIVAEVKQRS